MFLAPAPKVKLGLHAQVFVYDAVGVWERDPHSRGSDRRDPARSRRTITIRVQLNHP